MSPTSDAQMLGGHEATLKSHGDRITNVEAAVKDTDETLAEFRGAIAVGKWVMGFVGTAQGLNLLIELSKYLNK